MTAELDALVSAHHRVLAKYDMPSYAGVRARMDANENAWPLDADVAAELGAELAKLSPNRYPDSEQSALREVVCADLRVAPNQLVFGNGSQDLMMLIVPTFSQPREGSDGRARLLYPAPSFVGYPIASHIHGVVPVEVPLREDFELDPDAVERAIEQHRPNLAIFALPNNPTGTLWPRAEILRVAERHRDVIVIADEAYVEYSGETLLDALPANPNLMILRTLSKLGLAAVRVGFLVGAPALVAHVDKIRPPFNVGGLNQAAAAFLLGKHADRLRARVAAVVRERERLQRELVGIADLRVFPSRANYLWCRYGSAGDRRATQLCAHLERHGVMVRNFDGPGLTAGCFRATVGTPEENELFIAALRSFGSK